MRLPDSELKTKRVRVQIREIDINGSYKKGAKSENFIVLECDPKELKDFFLEKLMDIKKE